ncbi:MAG: O-antigen ligase family protein [Chloroflexia bacterium]|nr:O-antigen ligase family protein [Chloroflexia bacterium]
MNREYQMTPSTANARLSRALPLLLAAGLLLLAALLGQQPSARYLLLGGGAAGLLLLLQQPGLGLVALAALSFTLPLTFGTGSEVALTPPVLLVPGAALAWLVDGLRRQRLHLPNSRTLRPLLLFVAAGLLSLLAGNAYWDPMVPRPDNMLLVQLAQWGIFALSALAFLLAGALGSRERWLPAATWTFLALGSVVVLEHYLPPLRSLLGWSSPLMAGRSMFWTWLAALAAGQLLFNRRLKPLARFWLGSLLAASAYTVWFQMNDWVSGWAPFTVAAAAVLWLRFWRRNRAAGLVLILVLLALAAILYPTVFAHAGGERELETSWGGRQVLYRAVLEVANTHPLLGLGPASYRHYARTQWLSVGIRRALYLNPAVSSHNNYIDLYAQLGLLGLGLFLWFMVEVGRLGWQLAPRFQDGFAAGYVQGALGGLAGTLVAMMLADWFLPFVYNIGFPGFRTSALAWMFLGGLVALEQIGRKEAE